MKNMTRRLLALFLALLLCVSLFPAAALAEGEEEPAPPVGDDVSEDAELPVPEQASVSPEGSADLAALPQTDETLDAASGQCGDTLTWTLSDDGTLTISGAGPMPNYEWKAAPWYSRQSSIVSVRLEEGVTGLGDNAFVECEALQRVSLPASLETVGTTPLLYCPQLTELTVAEDSPFFVAVDNILYTRDGTDLVFGLSGRSGELTVPAGVTRIMPCAFFGCENLASVTLPEGLTEIGEMAFNNCTLLSSLSLPASLCSIGEAAFDWCSNLTELSFAGTTAQWEAVSIGADNVFLRLCIARCSDGVVDNGSKCGDDLAWSFDEDSGTLTISGTGETWNFRWVDDGPNVPWKALRGSIRELVVQEGVTVIGEMAFYRCDNLSHASLPASLGAIRYMAFYDCDSLTDVDFGGTRAQWAEVLLDEDNGVFTRCAIHCSDGDVDSSLHCGNGLTWSFDEDSGVLTISGTGVMWEFEWGEDYPLTPWRDVHTLIREVRVEEGVTLLGQNAFFDCDALTKVTLPSTLQYYNPNPFLYCEHLTDLSVAEDNPYFFSQDNILYIRNGQQLVLAAGGISGDLVIPDGVTGIWDKALSGCEELTGVTVPEGVTFLGANVFYWCPSLSSVSLPESLTFIGSETFLYCDALTDVNYAGTKAQWAAITIREDNDSLYSATIHCSDGDIDNSIKCGDDLTWSFDEDSGTLTITGTGSMWDYGNHSAPWSSFNREIRALELDSRMTRIGNYAFLGCNNLTDLTIPAALTSVGERAFGNCSNLCTLQVEGGNSSFVVEDNILYSSDLRTLILCAPGREGDLILPASLERMEDYAFEYCSVGDLVLPEGLTEIGLFVFLYADAGSIRFPTSLSQIGYGAFESCESLGELYYAGTMAQWEEIRIEDCNSLLFSGTIHCADGDLVYNRCGDDLTWSFDEDSGTLTITGTGSMWDWNYGGTLAPWHGFADRIRALSLAPGLSSLSFYAFADCSTLSSVTIPEGLERFGSGCFSGCSALTEILADENNPFFSSADGVVYDKAMRTLVLCPPGKAGVLLVPEGIVTIGDSALKGCSALTGIYLPEGLRVIEDFAFYQCESLLAVKLPESLESIGQACFLQCRALKMIRFLGPAPSIESATFSGVEATAYYPEGDTSWTADVRQNYGGRLDWQPYAQAETLAEGRCGDELTWTLDVNGLLTVSGYGDMWDFAAAQPSGIRELLSGALRGNGDPVPWGEHRSEILKLVVESGAAGVGDNAIAGCENLSSLELPAGLVRIGDSAFAGCVALTSVDFPAELEEIGSLAFGGCGSLEVIRFTGSAPAIAADAFTGVTATAHCPAGNASWNEDTMQNYGGTITWDNSVAFGTCGADLYWKLDQNGLLTIFGTGEMDSFSASTVPWREYRYSICSLVIEPGATSISQYSFLSFHSLQSVTIPDSVTRIGIQAFSYCMSLKSVTVPAGVTAIERYAFFGCYDLEEIQVAEDNPSYSSLDGVLYDKNRSTLIQCPSGKSGTLTIPETVATIKSSALDRCLDLEEIQVAESNSTYASANGVLYDKNMTTLLLCPSGYWGELSIPEGVTVIGENSVNDCRGISGIRFPESLTEIRYGAISNCPGLASLTIPKNVTSIENYGVSSCDSLTEITFEGPAPAFGEQAFASLNATAYYPGNDESWTEEVRQSCGGNIDWVAYAPPTHTPGDINGDGAVSNKDVTRLINYLKHGSTNVVVEALDVNGDGSVSNKDVTRLITYLKHKNVVIH